MENLKCIDQTGRLVENTSDKYKFLSSRQIEEVFKNKGFNLVDYKESKVRKSSKAGYQTHFLSFENDSLILNDKNKLRLMVKNSHDGKSSTELTFGVFRLVCSNGLVVGTKFFTERVRHVGNAEYKLNQAIDSLVSKHNDFKKLFDQLQSIQLTSDQAVNLARDMFKAIHPEMVSIKESRLLNPRRTADMQSDLWTVFNRVQESIIRNPIRYLAPNPKIDEVVPVVEKQHMRVKTPAALNRVNIALFQVLLNSIKQLEKVGN